MNLIIKNAYFFLGLILFFILHAEGATVLFDTPVGQVKARASVPMLITQKGIEVISFSKLLDHYKRDPSTRLIFIDCNPNRIVNQIVTEKLKRPGKTIILYNNIFANLDIAVSDRVKTALAVPSEDPLIPSSIPKQRGAYLVPIPHYYQGIKVPDKTWGDNKIDSLWNSSGLSQVVQFIIDAAKVSDHPPIEIVQVDADRAAPSVLELIARFRFDPTLQGVKNKIQVERYDIVVNRRIPIISAQALAQMRFFDSILFKYLSETSSANPNWRDYFLFSTFLLNASVSLEQENRVDYSTLLSRKGLKLHLGSVDTYSKAEIDQLLIAVMDPNGAPDDSQRLKKVEGRFVIYDLANRLYPLLFASETSVLRMLETKLFGSDDVLIRVHNELFRNDFYIPIVYEQAFKNSENFRNLVGQIGRTEVEKLLASFNELNFRYTNFFKNHPWSRSVDYLEFMSEVINRGGHTLNGRLDPDKCGPLLTEMLIPHLQQPGL